MLTPREGPKSCRSALDAETAPALSGETRGTPPVCSFFQFLPKRFSYTESLTLLR